MVILLHLRVVISLQLDVSCDGYVDWDEFCHYMLMQFKENEHIRQQKTQLAFQTPPKIKHLPTNKVRAACVTE